MVAGVTLRSSRLRAGLKTNSYKLKARRVSQRLLFRSGRAGPRRAGRDETADRAREARPRERDLGTKRMNVLCARYRYAAGAAG